MKKTIILSALIFLGLTLLNAQNATSTDTKVATGMTKADANGTITMGSAHMDGMDHKDGACCKGKDAKCSHDKKECSKECKKHAKKHGKKNDCCKKDAECCKNGGGSGCKKETSAACCKKEGAAGCKGHADADHHHAD